MAAFLGRHLHLTPSFRFGSAIACRADRWLHPAGTALRLIGHGPRTREPSAGLSWSEGRTHPHGAAFVRTEIG